MLRRQGARHTISRRLEAEEAGIVAAGQGVVPRASSVRLG